METNIGDLRSQIEQLQQQVNSLQPSQPRKRRRLGRPALVVGTVLALATGVGFGVEAAANPSTPSTTNVSFVSLATPYKLYTNKSFAAKAVYSGVVIGGQTKVPTNATTVELTVEAGGKTAGTLNFYPAGDPTGGSGQSLAWTAGGTATATIQENVGLSDELTFVNGATAATSTATIVGYSSQVTDGDISPADGTAGQVLTNTGTGAAWAPSSQAYSGSSSETVPLPFANFATVATLTVPAGNYLVLAESQEFNTPTTVYCYVYSPGGNVVTSSIMFGSGSSAGTATGQGLLTTTGGTLTLDCIGYGTANATLAVGEIDAVSVGAVSGSQVAPAVRKLELQGTTK